MRLRLLVAAGIAVALALVASGWGMELLFQRHVERRAAEELKTDIRALLAGLQIDAGGNLTDVRNPSDQRYSQPFSGLYWQISRGGIIIQRSRSLWDEELALPADILPTGAYHQHIVSGPRGRTLLAIEQVVTVTRGSDNFVFRATAALDVGEISQATKAFRTELFLALSALGVALLIAFWVALSVGLAPLRRLRHALRLLRSGARSRLTGQYPSEVEPLVNDLNDLLGRQEDLIDKAKARAATLAHGLKTPLTAMSVLAEELHGRNEHSAAQELLEHVANMQRHVEHELALTRSAHSQATASTVALRRFVDRLVRTMQRLPRGGDLRWSVDIDHSIAVKIDETTLGEVIGNILDNARKWAQGMVRIEAYESEDWVNLKVSDDGPGVPPADRASIVDRGKRLDEATPGTGLGLSIVSDIIGQLGGRIELTSSNLGGLGVLVRLPLKSRPRLGSSPAQAVVKH